jgi:hypothetical protein
MNPSTSRDGRTGDAHLRHRRLRRRRGDAGRRGHCRNRPYLRERGRTGRTGGGPRIVPAATESTHPTDSAEDTNAVDTSGELDGDDDSLGRIPAFVERMLPDETLEKIRRGDADRPDWTK